MNSLQRLYAEQDQSPWIDFIDRRLIDEGKLAELVDNGIRGLTSNPTIFAKAVATGQYDGLVKRMLADGASTQQIYEEIAITTCADAADVLRPVFDEVPGAGDGHVSIEVEPGWANITEATIERVRHLWRRMERPNVFVKIPATEAGLPAIEQATAEGINVNVTLMFSVDVYRKVARAYIAGLKQRLVRHEDVSTIASVASFFVSRVDTKVDKRLDEIGTDSARNARGWAAIANAKLAYQAYGEIFDGPEFRELRDAGGRVQRCLWGSTSTKNPQYRDVRYVEELIGPQTVNTMPLETINAFLDHGQVERTLDRGLDQARDDLRAVEAEGISMERVTAELVEEGVALFSTSFEELLAAIDGQREALARV